MRVDSTESRTAARALVLRDDFDRMFSEPERQTGQAMESMLALRFDTAPYAVPLREVAELGRAPPIVSVPSHSQEFLGLAAIRGVLVPAYDLGALLGHSHAEAQRWMLLVRMPCAIAYIFDGFEGHRLIPDTERAGDAVRDVDTWRPLILLSTLTQNLQE